MTGSTAFVEYSYMRLSLKYKIFLASGIWALLSLVVSIVVATNVKRADSAQEDVLSNSNIIQSFSNLMLILVDMETGLRGYLLSGEEVYLEPFSTAEGKFEEQVRALTDLIVDDSNLLSQLEKVKELKKEWIEGPVVNTMLNRKKLTRNLITQEQFIDSFKSSKSMVVSTQIRTVVEATLKNLNVQLQAASATQKSSAKTLFYSALLGLPFGVILGFGLLIYIMSQVDKQIQSVVKTLEDSCGKVFGTSQTLLTSGSELSQNSSSMANRFQGTGDSARSLKMMTGKNSENAKVAFQFSQESSKTAEHGGQEISDLILAMQTIQASANKIQEISQLIDDIAFQTNLLALNAAVEAARAGEHGRGFAVVADAVRTLAQKSAKATSEIKSLIQNNVDSATQGAGFADKAAAVFKDIIQSVAQVNAAINEVSMGSEKQATEITNISNSIEEVESESRSNLDISKQLGDYSVNLEKEAGDLRRAVTDLSLIISGGVHDRR